MSEPRERTRRLTILFLAGLILLEYGVYFSNPSHFFQGDSLFWLYNRVRSVDEFIQSFCHLNAEHWYRPLSQHPIESLLYPIVHLNPVPYRLAGFLLFAANTIVAFNFLSRLLKSAPAAILSTVFFSIHSVDAYVTYDVAFYPELLYTLFYVLAAITFLKFLETRADLWRAVSCMCFGLSLLSKESAVTLPAVLVALEILSARPIRGMIGDLQFHVFTLVAYLGYAGLYLKTGAYGMSPHNNIFANYLQGVIWAFDLYSPVKFSLLAAAALVGMLLCLRGLVRRDPIVWFGVSWFTIAIGPALPLYNHFLAYYLYLGILGIALALGRCFEMLPSSGFVRVMYGAGVLLVVSTTVVNIRNDVANNPVLGGSSKLAAAFAVDIKRIYPKLAPRTTVFILNEEAPNLEWDHGAGTLFKLIYSDPSIEARYSTLADSVSWDAVRNDDAIVFKLSGAKPVDLTEQVKTHPNLLNVGVDTSKFEYAAYSDALAVEPKEALAGTDFVTFKVLGYPETDVDLLYTINGGPPAIFTTRLDPVSRIQFFISTFNRKGIYRFSAFRPTGSEKWFRSDASIVIRSSLGTDR
jgi:hypothetical protein